MAGGWDATSESILQDPFSLGRRVTQTSLEADIEVPENSACSSFLFRNAWEGQGWPVSRRQLQTVCDPGLGDRGKACSADGCPGEQGRGPGWGGLPPAAVASLDGWDPFVVLIVEEGLLPWDLWLVCG